MTITSLTSCCVVLFIDYCCHNNPFSSISEYLLNIHKRFLFSGKGFDRHLFALKALYQTQGQKLPDIFTDPIYSHMNHIILSTSTLSSDAVLIGGFAPVTPDGYGIGYGIDDDRLGTQVTTYPSRDGAEFVKQMEHVLDDLHTVLNGKNFK